MVSVIKIRPNIIVTILLTSLVVFYWYSDFLKVLDNKPIPNDFGVYLKACERARGGENPYVQSDRFPYKYSLGALTFLMALPENPQSALKVFEFCGPLLWALAIFFGGAFLTWGSLILLLIGIEISRFGLREMLLMGQLETLLLLLAVLSARMLNHRVKLSAILLGILPGIKLPWLILLIPFIGLSWQRERRLAIEFIKYYALSFFIFSFVIPLPILGVQNTWQWTKSWFELLSNQPKGLYLQMLNQSLWRPLGRLSEVNPSVSLMIIPLTILIVLYLSFLLFQNTLKNRSGKAVLEWLSPWLILLSLISPLAWRWSDLLFVGLPFSVRSSLVWKRKWLFYPILLVAVLLHIVDREGGLIPTQFVSHSVAIIMNGGATLKWVLYLLLAV